MLRAPSTLMRGPFRWVRKVLHAVVAHGLGELEARLLLLGALLSVAQSARWLQVLTCADGLLPRRGARVPTSLASSHRRNSPDAFGSGNALTPFARMHSANFTPCPVRWCSCSRRCCRCRPRSHSNSPRRSGHRWHGRQAGVVPMPIVLSHCCILGSCVGSAYMGGQP